MRCALCFGDRQILSSQVTISLQTARLYSEMERLVAQRTAELTAKERTARLSALQLHKLIGTMRESIVVESESRYIIMWNQAFVDMFVRTPEHRAVLSQCRNLASGAVTTNEEFAPMQRDAWAFVRALGIDRLMVDPDAFFRRLLDIWTRREPVFGDVLHLADGRVFTRDFIPLTSDGAAAASASAGAGAGAGASSHGSLWVVRDITKERNVQEALFAAALQGRNEFLAFIWFVA